MPYTVYDIPNGNEIFVFNIYLSYIFILQLKCKMQQYLMKIDMKFQNNDEVE